MQMSVAVKRKNRRRSGTERRPRRRASVCSYWCLLSWAGRGACALIGVLASLGGGACRGGHPPIERGGWWAQAPFAAEVTQVDPLRLGVLVGDRAEAPTDTATRFARDARRARDRGAVAVVVLGDIADDAATIEDALRSAARAGLPVLALSGEREPLIGFRAAAAAAGALDLTLKRLVRFVSSSGSVTVAALPGSRDPFAAPGSERFRDQDLAGVVTALSGPRRGERRLLLAHMPPRLGGDATADRGHGGYHVGDLDVAALLSQLPGVILIAGHVPEAVAGPSPAGVGRTVVQPGAGALVVLDRDVGVLVESLAGPGVQPTPPAPK